MVKTTKSQNKSKKAEAQATQKRNMMVSVVAAALAIVGVAILLLSNNGGTRSEVTVDAETGEIIALSPGLISPVEYQSFFVNNENSEDHFLLDVRTPEEFAQGHIAGAVNIPVQVLDQYLSEIPTDQPIVLYCRSGNRSNQAMRILQGAGYTDIYDIDGGTIAWAGQNLPLQ